MINKIRQRIKNLNPSLKFQKKSYAQCGEDIIVKFIFDSIGIQNPSYIDIGAHHPNYIINTAIFYKEGSKGINIEPDPTLFKEFLKLRKRDININVGVAAKDGLMDFFMMTVRTLNSFSKEEAVKAEKEGYKIVEVKKIQVLPLAKILAEHSEGVFPDFLSLDVEGVDMEILESVDFEKNAPTVICVETVSFSDSGNGVKDFKIADFLQGKGYMIYADTFINTIFVKNEKWINRN